jgi:PAS domain S-box-containing protein
MTTKVPEPSPVASDFLAIVQDLVETSQDLVWQCDGQGRYIFLNPAWEVTFGYRHEEMLGRKFSDFQSPEFAERDTREFARLMQGATLARYQTVHLGKSGNPIHLVFNAKCVRDATGTIVGTRGIAHDVTERVLAETSLRESEEKFKFVFDHSPVGKSFTRPSGEINVNQAFCDMVGYSRAPGRRPCSCRPGSHQLCNVALGVVHNQQARDTCEKIRGKGATACQILQQFGVILCLPVADAEMLRPFVDVL